MNPNELTLQRKDCSNQYYFHYHYLHVSFYLVFYSYHFRKDNICTNNFFLARFMETPIKEKKIGIINNDREIDDF